MDTRGRQYKTFKTFQLNSPAERPQRIMDFENRSAVKLLFEFSDLLFRS